MCRLKPTDYHMYLDGQQYFIGVVLDISRKATAVKRMGNINSDFKKNLNAFKPSEHPPSGEKMSKGLGGNIGCRDKTSSWYQTGSPM